MALQIFKQLKVTSVLLTALISLSACEMKNGWELPEFTPLHEKERSDWTELKRVNYAAADVMYQRAKPQLYRFHKVELIELNNVGEPIAEGPAPITWLVPQQIGNRLAQLGLKVDQPNKTPMNSAHMRSEGTFPLQLVPTGAVKPVQTKRSRGHIYVEGEYVYLEDEILVSLRLVDGTRNTILSSIEYDLDVDADMFALINPAAKDRMFSSGWMY